VAKPGLRGLKFMPILSNQNQRAKKTAPRYKELQRVRKMTR
jgi:hypothetical protein